MKFVDFTAEIKSRKKQYNQAIDRVLDSGWFILGPEVKKFEDDFAKYLGIKYCIGVGNGLEALQISLMSLGIGSGDEVITTPISAVATTLAILAVGAKPVFVDTDEFGLIDSDLIPGAMTSKTKAILPVHLYGNAVNLEKIQDFCKKNRLYLIEDACQAHGAMYHSEKLGTFGAVNCFSFYPTKNLGAFGDGGAIVTDSKKIADTCVKIRDYGQESKYIHSVYGLNSRLDEVQAAILQVKLRHLDQDNQKRRVLAKRYLENLSLIAGVQIITPGKLSDSNFHIFAIRTDKRDNLLHHLSVQKTPSLVHYPLTIPDQPLFKGKYKYLDLTRSRQFVKETLSLPIHPWLSISEVDRICEQISGFFKSRAIS